MFKKVKNRNHVLSQPVHKHIKKHTTQKMVLNHPYRVCLLYATNKNSHKFMCEVWFKWWRVRDSNPWMLAWKASELTVSPTRHTSNCLYSITNNIPLRQAFSSFFRKKIFPIRILSENPCITSLMRNTHQIYKWPIMLSCFVSSLS